MEKRIFLVIQNRDIHILDSDEMNNTSSIDRFMWVEGSWWNAGFSNMEAELILPFIINYALVRFHSYIYLRIYWLKTYSFSLKASSCQIEILIDMIVAGGACSSCFREN